jgi:hypothetical protein
VPKLAGDFQNLASTHVLTQTLDSNWRRQFAAALELLPEPQFQLDLQIHSPRSAARALCSTLASANRRFENFDSI